MTGALPPSSRCVRLTDLGGGLQHLLAGGDVAGDRDHVDLRVVDQRVADAVAAAEHDVDDALGQDLGEHLGQLQRGQRRLLGRLEDDRVAAGDAPARASTPSSSADSSTARSSRRRRSGRAGSSRCGRADIRRRPAPGMVRTAPAKKRKQSTIAGISSLSTALIGLPQLSASSAAKAFASASMRVGDLQQVAGALRRRGARPADEGLFGRVAPPRRSAPGEASGRFEDRSPRSSG